MEFGTLPHKRKRVLIALSDKVPPELCSIEDLVASKVQINGEELVDAGLGDWLGFYDWLRDAPKSIIGIRLWLDQDLKCIELIRTCVNAVVAEDGRNLTIFLGSDRKFDPSLSDDQDFGANQLFIGKRVLAFTFNAPVDR